jgi:hypothetical protein
MARLAEPECTTKSDDDTKAGVRPTTTTRLNIALAFSQIKTGETSKELAELADVADLLIALEDVLPADRWKELCERTEVLRTRLG